MKENPWAHKVCHSRRQRCVENWKQSPGISTLSKPRKQASTPGFLGPQWDTPHLAPLPPSQESAIWNLCFLWPLRNKISALARTTLGIAPVPTTHKVLENRLPPPPYWVHAGAWMFQHRVFHLLLLPGIWFLSFFSMSCKANKTVLLNIPDQVQGGSLGVQRFTMWPSGWCREACWNLTRDPGCCLCFVHLRCGWAILKAAYRIQVPRVRGYCRDTCPIPVSCSSMKGPKPICPSWGQHTHKLIDASDFWMSDRLAKTS